MRRGRSNEAFCLRGSLQHVIALRCPRDKPLTALQFQDLTMLRIVKAHGRERGGDPLCQRLIDRTSGGKAAVAIAWAAPEDSNLAFLELPFLPQRGEGMPTDGARVVLA